MLRLAKAIKLTPFRLGLVLVVVAAVVGVALFSRGQILTTLKPGDHMAVELPEQYQVKPYLTKVKAAGVPVGEVIDVERTERGTALTEVKLDKGVIERLGSAPTAEIRPTTLLGGNYYVDLVRGGLPGEPAVTELPEGDEVSITADRSQLPVELGQVAATLHPDARDGARAAVHQLDGTLEQGGTDAIKSLLRTAPATLGPAGGTLEGLQGTRPEDLNVLVKNLQQTGSVLSRDPQRLDAIVGDLQTVSAVLDRRSPETSAALDTFPDTLRTANVGLDRLDGSLAKLRETAGPARPIVRELDTTLRRLDPVLGEARPVVNDLRGVLTDLRPAVETLVPASQKLTQVSDDVRGPVMERVNGPIMDTVLQPYHGSGIYEGNGADFEFYKALGYAASNLANTAEYTDRNGATAAFHPGVGPGAVSGTPISLEQMFQRLAGQQAGGPR